MKAKNFTVRDDIYVVCEGREYDLHNFYDFRELAYDIHAKTLCLRWERTKGERVPSGIPDSLTLFCDQVRLLSITPRERSLPFSEDTCLNNIAFWSEAVGVPDIFCSKTPPEDSWHWVFEFMSGFRVYVQAQTIEVMKGPNNASEATR